MVTANKLKVVREDSTNAYAQEWENHSKWANFTRYSIRTGVIISIGKVQKGSDAFVSF